MSKRKDNASTTGAGAGTEAEAEDFKKCPKCFRTQTLHTNMKFMVTSCGHRICDHCMKRLLGATGVGQCYIPGCGTTLRQTNFESQIYEDTAVQSEIQVRQHVVNEFNKTQDDFDNLDAFNQYLEDVEDIIYNLVNKINIDETKALVEKNRHENKRLIQSNRSRKEDDERLVREQVKAEEQRKKMLWKQAFTEIDQEKLNKKKDKEQLMQQLAAVDESRAGEVIENFKRAKKQKTQRKAQVKAAQPKTYAVKPRAAIPQARLQPYVYSPTPQAAFHVADGHIYQFKTLEEAIQSSSLGEKVVTRPSMPAPSLAGGHVNSYVAARGLQEAYSCLSF